MRRLRNKSVLLSIVLWLVVVPVLAQKIDAIGAISMTVADVDRSVRFYSQVLGFDKIDDSRSRSTTEPTREVRMRLGDEWIELVQFSRTGRPIPADSRSNDYWFQHIAIIVSDMDRAYRKLRAHHVLELSIGGPQRLPDWNKDAAGIRAFYFADPDGHPLEILHFPPAKGAKKWHRTDRLFLGIDHTAIVVSNTERSLDFYRDLLGLTLAGTSENFGPEQDKLNHIAGARLRITTLRASSGARDRTVGVPRPTHRARPAVCPADFGPGAPAHDASELTSRNTGARSRVAALGANSHDADGQPVWRGCRLFHRRPGWARTFDPHEVREYT